MHGGVITLHKMKRDHTLAIALLVTAILLIAASGLITSASAADKYLWEQVSEEGFGDLTNDYAWSMANYTINGTEYLYVGTLNTNLSSGVFDPANWNNVTDGCEIWRTNGSMNGSNYDWEQVVGPSGTQNIIRYTITPPFTTDVSATAGFGTFCMGARKMLVYQDLLWVGTMRQGCEVWVTNGTHWKLANVPGFSDVLGPVIGYNSTSVRSMAIFNDALYVGVDNAENGAMVFKYNGSTNFNDIGNALNIGRWERVNEPGFGEPGVNLGVGELIPFSASEEYLYAGTWNFTAQELLQMLLDLNFSMLDGCQVWRTNGTVNGSGPELIWEKVANGGFNSPLNGAVMSSVVFDGSLYMGTMNFGTGAEIWRTANGTDWERVADLGFFNFAPPDFDFIGFGNGYVWNMIVFDNKLFVGTLNPILGCQLWMSTTGNEGSFEQVNVNGMNEERTIPIDIDSLLFMGIDQYGVRTFAEFNGALHLGTASFGDWIDKGIALEAENFSTSFSKYVGCEVWRTDGTMYTPPEIEVNKTVWDPASEQWIAADCCCPLRANVGDTVRFNVTIHANGTYNLTNLVVMDFLSSSLEYAGNATFRYPNGTVVSGEPDINLSDSWECDTYFTSFTILLWDLTGLELEPCQTVTLEYNATVARCGVDTGEIDINFVGAFGLSTESPEYGYSWDYALVYAPCPDGNATDPTGLVKDVYLPSETVYATGSGFRPNSTVDIYIVSDRAWTNGDNVSGNVIFAVKKNVSTNVSGDIVPTEIWLNPIPGEYDMFFDANQNGLFEVGVDVVDHPNHPGFIVRPPQVSVLAPFGLLALVGLLSIIATSTLVRKRKR